MLTHSDEVVMAAARVSAAARGRVVEPLEAYTSSEVIDNATVLSSDEVIGPPIVKVIRGSNNTIFCGYRSKIPRLKVTFVGSNNIVFLGPEVRAAGHFEIVGDNAMIYIGAFTSISSLNAVQWGNDGCLFIGDHGMLSARLFISNTDAHGIYDLATGDRLNGNRDVFIDDHVWLARDVRVNKGACIGRDTAVGQGSIVNGVLAPNCVYAGVPARKLRENTNWSRRAEPTWDDCTTSTGGQILGRVVKRVNDRIAKLTEAVTVKAASMTVKLSVGLQFFLDLDTFVAVF